MIQVRSAGRSTAGRVREVNEDAHVVVSPADPVVAERRGHLAAIADGLGGHAAGQVASATAIEAVAAAYYAPTSPARIEPALQHAVQTANLRVHEARRRDPAYRAMQTTLSCLVLAGSAAYLAHVGDSRIYLIRGGTLTRLTDDHSEAAELVRLRLARPDSLADHPRRNVLTRTIGSQLLLRPDFRRVTVEAGDTFLLCTDGLWSEVSEEEILAAGAIESPDDTCAHLLGLQVGRASLDNATALVVKVLSVDPGASEGEGWLTTIVNRLVGPRPGRRRGGPPMERA